MYSLSNCNYTIMKAVINWELLALLDINPSANIKNPTTTYKYLHLHMKARQLGHHEHVNIKGHRLEVSWLYRCLCVGLATQDKTLQVLIRKQWKHKTPLTCFFTFMSFRHIIDLVDFFEGVSESVIVMEFAEGMISTSTILHWKAWSSSLD